MVRRHARSTEQFRYGPALQTVSGNYVAAKRKGVIDGVDYGFTGEVCFEVLHLSCLPVDAQQHTQQFAVLQVRFVQVDALRRQLDAGHVVLLSNLGKFG